MTDHSQNVERRRGRWPIFLPATIMMAGTFALARDTGSWVAVGPVAQVNIGCSQVWECQANQDVLHSSDTYVWHTPNKLTFGVCNAAGGPADSCNECAASPPNEPCEWELRKTGQQ